MWTFRMLCGFGIFSFGILGCWFLSFPRMFVDYVFDVVHAAVAHFKLTVLRLNILWKPSGLREMFVNEIEEVSSNIGFYILTIWRVIPDDISCSVSFLDRRSVVVVVWQCVTFVGGVVNCCLSFEGLRWNCCVRGCLYRLAMQLRRFHGRAEDSF